MVVTTKDEIIKNENTPTLSSQLKLRMEHARSVVQKGGGMK